MTRENLLLAGIYGGAIGLAIALGLLEAFAWVGAALTTWVVAIEINSRADDYFRRKYAPKDEPRRRASGL